MPDQVSPPSKTFSDFIHASSFREPFNVMHALLQLCHKIQHLMAITHELGYWGGGSGSGDINEKTIFVVLMMRLVDLEVLRKI